MKNPTLDYIHCSGEQCEIYAPDEGTCRECMSCNDETFPLMDEGKDMSFYEKYTKDGEQE